jgi:alginate O-acetyltransferase complex protein AlgI
METVHYIFDYSLETSKAFFFNRYDFWLFFTVLIVFYGFVYKKIKHRNLYLLLFSLFFYFKSGGFYFLLLLLSTLIDYLLGKKIYHSVDHFKKKIFVSLSVLSNLGILFYFKYSAFIIDSINNWFGTKFQVIDYFAVFANKLSNSNFEIENLFLPIGISFYTFQTISYSIDIYRGHVKPVKNILDFAFYVSFFPQLVAGPIVRASEFIPQIYKRYSLTQQEFGRAILLIITGMTKKILIADYLGANFVVQVFEDPERFIGFQNLLAIYGFALQIYGDFSGYTDIAIGIALLLGFRLPTNFNSPYKAQNITDFWRRWHISLSSWLRDYLYIPLGGNRGGKILMYRNLFLTMLLGGLWHGAAWRFVLWGALHGIALAIHKLIWGGKKNHKKSGVQRVISSFLTFHFVCFCWIFFAVKDIETGILMLKLIIYEFHPELILDTIIGYRNVVAVMLIGYLAHFFPFKFKKWYTIQFTNLSLVGKAAIMIITGILLFQVMSVEIQPFIYFQF